MAGRDPVGGPDLYAAVDVHYLGEYPGEGDARRARAALVAARDARFTDIAGSRTIIVPEPASYRPGEFYLRELPPLRALCQRMAGLALVVIDGYVDLDPAGRPGLGARLHAELGVPVVGVAKTFFRGATHAALVCRGRSARPLYVTAAGIELADAARMVSQMGGSFRIPDALRLADRLARGTELPTWRSGPPGSSCHSST